MHALTNITENIRKTTKAKPCTSCTAERLVQLAALLCQVACNQPLDFERTRKGPVFDISGEISLHRCYMMSR